MIVVGTEAEGGRVERQVRGPAVWGCKVVVDAQSVGRRMIVNPRLIIGQHAYSNICILVIDKEIAVVAQERPVTFAAAALLVLVPGNASAWGLCE